MGRSQTRPRLKERSTTGVLRSMGSPVENEPILPRNDHVGFGVQSSNAA